MSRVTAERIALNSDKGILRGSGQTTASTKDPPTSPPPLIRGAAHSPPRPPPERARISAKARATERRRSSSTTRTDAYLRITGRPEPNLGNETPSIEGNSSQRRHHRTAARRRGRSITTKGGQGAKTVAKPRQSARVQKLWERKRIEETKKRKSSKGGPEWPPTLAKGCVGAEGVYPRNPGAPEYPPFGTQNQKI